jgi:DNA uptake protein ComE-like DNA-binding protein
MMKRGTKATTMAALLALGLLAWPAAAQVGKPVTIVDANRATEEELKAIPQLTDTLIQAILEKRPLSSVSELHSILTPALTREQAAEVYKKIFVHINLNKASKEQILLIPGVGNRLLHEFEEYRPYKNLAQFRKEIGKYVNGEELARLEQYVFVPINLNTASDEDILSIPGLGRRMVYEFKEYRPYSNIEKFRKEIGKYVNAKEIARLERFVTVE